MFPNNIKAEMARYDMSQKDLAEYLGLSLKTVQSWLLCKKDIPSSALVKMAERWKVSVDYLLGIKKAS